MIRLFIRSITYGFSSPISEWLVYYLTLSTKENLSLINILRCCRLSMIYCVEKVGGRNHIYQVKAEVQVIKSATLNDMHFQRYRGRGDGWFQGMTSKSIRFLEMISKSDSHISLTPRSDNLLLLTEPLLPLTRIPPSVFTLLIYSVTVCFIGVGNRWILGRHVVTRLQIICTVRSLREAWCHHAL